MKNCKCGGKTSCIDSRSNPDGNTRRRYECRSCGERIYTLEIEVKKHIHSSANKIANESALSSIKEKIISLLNEISP